MADKKITSVNVQSLREALAQAVTGRTASPRMLLVVADGKLTVTTTDTRVTTSRMLLARFADAWTATAEYAALARRWRGWKAKGYRAHRWARAAFRAGGGFFWTVWTEHFSNPAEQTRRPMSALSRLREALALVGYAAAKNDSRPYLNGVLLGPGTQSPDGHRIGCPARRIYARSHRADVRRAFFAAALETGARCWWSI